MRQTDAVWGKSPEEAVPYPLTRHLLDTWLAAGSLWDHWLRPGLRELLARMLTNGDEPRARSWVQQAAALHDVGKANPAFQLQVSTGQAGWKDEQAQALRAAGLPLLGPAAVAAFSGARAARRHEYVGHVVLTGEHPSEADPAVDWLPLAVAGHHGRWINGTNEDRRLIKEHLCHGAWSDMGQDIIAEIEQVTGLRAGDAPALAPEDAGVVIPLVTGLVVLADWIASSDQCVDGGRKLMQLGVALAGWAAARSDDIEELLVSTLGTYHAPADPLGSVLGDYEPRPLQSQAIELAPRRGLWLVAQPTGEGKTEAALLRHMADDHGEGLVFALPTRATTDAMQHRLERIFAGTGNAVVLSHQLASRHEARTVGAGYGTDWYSTSIRRLVAPVSTATVDQVLSGALRGKHAALRLLALANKHVVVDEVHTLDHYQTQLLAELLSWWGRTGTRVTLLSATLPQWQRRELEQAYSGTDHGHLPYPGHRIIDDGAETVVTGMSAVVPPLDFRTTQSPSRQEHASIHVEWARKARSDHPEAHLGIVVNTVEAAIEVASRLRDLPGSEVICLHSRMTAGARHAVEERLRQRLGKAPVLGLPVVLVGTQVVEASLDIDLDMMSTDLAPAPSLIQRAGRLWRFRDPAARSRRLPPGSDRVLQVVRRPDALPYLPGELDRVWNEIRSAPRLAIPEGVQPLVDETAFDLSQWGSAVADPGTRAEMGSALAHREEANRSRAKIRDGLLDDWGLDYLCLVELTDRDLTEELMGTRFIDRPTGTFLLLDDAAALVGLSRSRRACIAALDSMVPASGPVGHALAAASVESLGGQDFEPRWKSLSSMRPVLRSLLSRHGLSEDPFLGIVRAKSDMTHP